MHRAGYKIDINGLEWSLHLNGLDTWY